jgi:hypothetical protein
MKYQKARFVACVAAIVASTALVQNIHATPYASCITNNAGTVTFYLNESGGNVTVYYDDGTTNASFDGYTTGVNLPSGPQSFSLTGHNSYTILVNKTGSGSATVLTTQAAPTPRGIDVNKIPTSPYFGEVYAVNAGNVSSNLAIRCLNSDLTGITTNAGGVAWTNSASSPYRIAVADDGYLMVGDFASAHSGVWRVDPTLTSNELVLGPIGQSAGQAAGSQGAQFSRPLLIGNLATGGSATLYTVDAGTIPLNANQLNSILVYSNITLADLPRETPPDLLGPEVCLNLILNNNYPGITVGPNGYIYASSRRDGPSGGSANLQVYDANLNLLWNSLYNNGVNDYFAQQNTGTPTATTGLADSAVSPDGKYVAGLGYGDNHIIVCALTNGIPDVSTLVSISNTVSQTSAGRGIAWDAADNIYVSSSGGATFQEWTLGFTATAVTTGNASGPTGFSMVLPSTVVSVTASNALGGALLSQANTYGNPTNAVFTITRTGSTGSSLTVFFSLSGTAASGTYTATATNKITIAAGQSSTNVTITAVTDGIPRAGTTIVLNLHPSGVYSVASPGTGLLTLLNTASPQVTASPVVASMYNAFSNDYASFVITRLGDTNAAAFTVNSFSYAGTAVAGVDYTLPLPVTFNPGDLVQTDSISPLISGQLPVDSTTNVYVGNKTAIISVSTGTGYTGSTNAAVLNILDSANPTTTVLFADPLTSSSDSANWTVTSANNNMQANAIDDGITFGYDLQNGDPNDFGAIPLPPNGAATALRVTVNKSSAPGGGAAAGVNLYPVGLNLTGDYAVRFSMNIVQGLSSSSSTEGPLFGIDHSGIDTNWFSASGIISGWDAAGTNENWSSDGIWYWVNADNDYSGGAYLAYTGLGGTNGNTGWTPIGSATASTFANAFKTNVFSGGIYWGPGLVSSGSVLNGDSANNWPDVEIKQINDVVTLSIDKTPVFVYTNTTTFTHGTLMLGYDDPFSSVGSPDGAVYYSNLRVVSLVSPSISQLAVNAASKTVVINFTTDDGDAVAGSFALQSAAVVTGPYADVSGASITELSAGAFQAVVSESGSKQFYRIRQK